jgi:thiol-disulfide isomerase/thioredoxin
VTMTPTDGRFPSPNPLPRCRGLVGAIKRGLLAGGIIVVSGLAGGGVIWLTTKNVAAASLLTARMALFGVVIAGVAILGRWLGGAAKKDVGQLGSLLGVLLAGYLTTLITGSSEGGPAIGQVVDVVGPTVDGSHFDLSQYRGKIVLVDFWATWCVPCVAELPNIQAAYDRHHGDGLEVVSVSFDFERPALVEFLKAKPMRWPQIYFDNDGSRGFENPLGRRFGIQAIPHLLLIDREGKLVARGLRGEQIERAVAGELGLSAPSAPWYTRLTDGAAWLLNCLLVGMMESPWWLLVTGTVGGALTEVTLRCACMRRGQIRGSPNQLLQ